MKPWSNQVSSRATGSSFLHESFAITAGIVELAPWIRLNSSMVYGTGRNSRRQLRGFRHVSRRFTSHTWHNFRFAAGHDSVPRQSWPREAEGPTGRGANCGTDRRCVAGNGSSDFYACPGRNDGVKVSRTVENKSATNR